MSDFQSYLREVKPLVDARIAEVATRKLKDDNLVGLLTRGKRLRAGLLILVNEAVGRRRSSKALDLACAIELAHSASLVIDDMLDEDEVRRGLPTIHVTEGQKRAMLDTVGILSLPYDLVVPFGEQYVQSLAETQRGMVTGVLKEMLQTRPELPASKLYDTIITQKTGKPFGLASAWGCLSATNGNGGIAPELQSRWRTYGVRVGKAMQIADDIADLRSLLFGDKRSGFGSELLLFRCVTAERLAKELFSDIRKLDLHLEKAKDLWSEAGAQKSLVRRLDREILAAQEWIRTAGISDPGLRDLLISVPRDVARMMRDEAVSAGMKARHDPSNALPSA
jgi:geranylgeranyl diphosphate synthase type II